MTFIEELEQEHKAYLGRIDGLRDECSLVVSTSEMVKRLKLALRQEMEAAEIAARWMVDTQRLDVKLAMAKMCGDEARHFRLISARLTEMGVDAASIEAAVAGHSRFYDFLAGLTDDVERIAAACFAREAIGYVRNEQFIEYCTRSEDAQTARMYRDEIQPDEWSHVEAGRALLEKYAVDPDVQERARDVVRKTLGMAESALATMVHEMGMSNAPGC